MPPLSWISLFPLGRDEGGAEVLCTPELRSSVSSGTRSGHMEGDKSLSAAAL